jgi:hypothetical protein
MSGCPATRPAARGCRLGRSRLQGIPASHGLICGLIRVGSAASAVGCQASGSGATEPNPTCLNHQPQNSKAGEIRARSESHEIAVAECADCASDRSDGNSQYRRMPGQGPRRKTEPGCKRRAGTPTEGVPPLPVSVLVSVVTFVGLRGRVTCTHTAGQQTGEPADLGLQTW